MSQYATATQFKVWGLPARVLDDAQDPVTDSDVDEFLEAASGIADARFRARYTVPLASPYPADISQAVCKIAALEILQARIGYNPDNPADAAMELAAEKAHQLLRDYAKGLMLLDQSADATPSVDEAAPAVSVGDLRGFSILSTGFDSDED